MVGWGATKSGLGVGLSLPLLAACGLALPAVKLPVAVSDLAAALGERRGRCAPVLLSAPMTLCCGAVAGAVAAWGVLHVPAGTVAVVAPLLALRAAANAGALGVLLLAGGESGRAVTDAVCLLAVAQGAGAWLATHRGEFAPPV